MAKGKSATVKALKRRAWKSFSEFIRRGAADRNGMVSCYTCGARIHWRECHCGHAIGGRHNAVLFDPEICRVQCVRCNIFLAGNYGVFAAKLIRENGIEWYEEKLIAAKSLVKYGRADFEEIISRYGIPGG
jgi:Bacteriophage Lambda NinG protein